LNSRGDDEIVRHFAARIVGDVVGMHEEFGVFKYGTTLFEMDIRHDAAPRAKIIPHKATTRREIGSFMRD
jgi:hypothetical protein